MSRRELYHAISRLRSASSFHRSASLVISQSVISRLLCLFKQPPFKTRCSVLPNVSSTYSIVTTESVAALFIVSFIRLLKCVESVTVTFISRHRLLLSSRVCRSPQLSMRRQALVLHFPFEPPFNFTFPYYQNDTSLYSYGATLSPYFSYPSFAYHLP